MATLKQMEANRRNAQKSTGPKTPAGKAAAARNSLRHGLLAHDLILPGEDPNGEFDVLCAGLESEWQPVTPTGRFLVRELANLEWRLQRHHRAEQGYYAEQGIAATAEVWGDVEPPADPDQRRAIGSRILGRTFAAGSHTFVCLNRYETSLRRAYHRILKQLETRRAEKTQNFRTNPISPQLEQIKATS